MRKRTEKGFSLTELLVAVVVGGIIMAGIYSAFMSSINVFSSQQEVSQMQFNAKAVVSFMKQNLANAGSGIQTDIPIPVLVLENNASNLSGHYLVGADALQIRTFGNAGDVMSIEKYMGSAATATMGESYMDNNPVNGDNTSVGNLLLVWGGTSTPGNYALVEITHAVHGGTDTETSVNFSPGLSVYNTPAGLGDEYDGGFAIMIDKNSMNSLTLFVDSNGVLRLASGGATGSYNLANPADANNPAALPLLDNVEDFQIQIGYDTNGDNIVDNWNWTYNSATNTPDINQALVLRCYLLARSQRTERFVNNVARPDIDPADGVTYGGAPDNVRRRMYSFTVQLRNRLN